MLTNPKNIKLLNTNELISLKNRYNIKLKDDNVIVAINTRNQTTIHKLDKNFNLRINDRKFTITKRAIKLWENELRDYNVIDIQHTINSLIVNKTIVNCETIKNVLKPKNDFI